MIETEPRTAPAALAGVVDALGMLAAGTAEAVRSGPEAVQVVELLARINRLVTAILLQVVPALPDDGHFVGTPHRTGARWLAATLGVSVKEAAETLAAGAALPALPRGCAAVAVGELSGPQVRAVTDAALAHPAAEGELLEAARSQSLFGLRSVADRIKAAAHDDREADRLARRHRHLRCGLGAAGAFQIAGGGPADEGEVVLRALRCHGEARFRAAVEQGDKPTFEALQWDALVEMARASLGDRRARTPGGAATKVIVRVDHDALVRGHSEPGETCDIAGLGPIPVAAVQRILARGDVFLAAVLTKAERVSGVVHLGRRPTALQRTALEWLHPTCRVDGCDGTILDWDHRIDWAASRHTVLEELDGLCGPHHRLKTNHNWRLERGAGKRPLRPPGHPGHPGDPPARRARRGARVRPRGPGNREPGDPARPGAALPHSATPPRRRSTDGRPMITL